MVEKNNYFPVIRNEEDAFSKFRLILDFFWKIVLKNPWLFSFCCFLALLTSVINYNIGVLIKDSLGFSEGKIQETITILLKKNIKKNNNEYFPLIKEEVFKIPIHKCEKTTNGIHIIDEIISQIEEVINLELKKPSLSDQKLTKETKSEELSRLKEKIDTNYNLILEQNLLDKFEPWLNEIFLKKIKNEEKILDTERDVLSFETYTFSEKLEAILLFNKARLRNRKDIDNYFSINENIDGNYNWEKKNKILLLKIFESLINEQERKKMSIFDRYFQLKIRFFWLIVFSKEDIPLFSFLLYLSVLFLILKGCSSLFHFYLMHYAYDLIEKELKKELFNTFLRAKYEDSSTVSEKIINQFSNYLDIIAYDVWFIPNRLIYTISSILQHVLFDFQFGVENNKGANTNWPFLSQVFFLFVLSAFSQMFLFVKSRKISTEARNRIDEDNAKIFNSINRLQYVKMVSGENYEFKSIEKQLNETFEKNKLALKWTVLFKALPNYLISGNIPVYFIGLTVSTSLFFDKKYRMSKSFQEGNFIRYYFTVQKLNSEFTKIFDSLLNLQELYSAAEIVSKTYSVLNSHLPHAPLKELSHFNERFVSGDIEFDNLIFSYPNREKIILEKFSFIFKKNEFYGVVGPNGSGKTTIIKLLLKLYEPTNGIVKINDNDLKNINTVDIHKSVCFQNNKPGEGFFKGSIADNVFYPNEFVPSEFNFSKLELAAKKVGIYDFINSLPNKFDTIIQEKGSDLSEGQKQQISGMKVFINDYEVYIFDEPLSNVAPDVRKEGLENIYDKCKNKTTIVIDHHEKTFDNEKFKSIYRFTSKGLIKEKKDNFFKDK